MRIGYLFRGFLGDVKWDADGKEISTPDGNATYSWSIEHECHKRGYKLIPLGPNLDAPAAMEFEVDLFAAFSRDKRAKSYERMLRYGWTKLSDKKFPELDLVLIEWRWPIPGRNTPGDVGFPLYQNDLARQEEILRHYLGKGTPVVIWDLDHKLTRDDEHHLQNWPNVSIIETAVRPRREIFIRQRVEPPTVAADLCQHDIDERMPTNHIGYIGSRYERDETIDYWIKPIALPHTHRVKFWGKWEPSDEVQARWPGVKFEGRIGVKSFYEAYSRVAIVPLLAKQSYYECGFITPRPWEAILFGSIPVGLTGHLGIDQYVDRVAIDASDLLEIGRSIRTISSPRRRILREEAAHKLSHMDVRHFVDVLERMAGGDVSPEPADESEEADGKE